MNRELLKSPLYKKNVLQQIKGFYYVVRLGNISKASEYLNLTQSTVTLQIQSLERDLGTKLFERNSKPLKLTKDGEEFYKLACPLIQEFESVIHKFLENKITNKNKEIRIAAHHIAITYLMPQIICEFKKLYNNIKIIIKNISPQEALEQIKSDKIDLALFPNLAKIPEIEYLEANSYDPILIMNKNHKLAGKYLNSLKELKDSDLIRIDKSLITLPLFENIVEEFDLKGTIELENGNWEILKKFVKANDLIAVISELAIDKNDDFISKNLSKFFPKMTYSIAYKRGKILSPEEKMLVKYMIKS